MHPEQWQKINDLFHAALERAPHERAAFLATACHGQARLQREVTNLLAAHEQPGEVWAVSAANLAADWLSAQPAAPTLSGQHFGHYQIQSLLGKGGMGEVWRAHDARLGRDVALKVLPAAFAQDADRLRRFEQEARAISALNHHNIITIHEIGQHDERHFIITELVDGVSLRQHLHGTRLPVLEALDLTIQIASALAAAHQAGVVHRDIKPENVMLRPDGYVKVLDFGLAKLTGWQMADGGLRIEEAETSSQPERRNPPSAISNPQSTDSGQTMGTASYMSPEQASGLEIDARSDIWSLGCVLYEMVTGRLAFKCATTRDIIAAILQTEPTAITEAASELPAELDRIARKALSKDCAARYQTVNELASDLMRLKKQLEAAAEPERTVPPENKHATDIFKRRKPAVAIALLVVIALAGAAYRYLAPSGKGPINSIAVLPFANASGDPNLEYLSDGVSESLINTLAQLPGVKVIARGSAFKYKGKEVDLEEVARLLGVQAIVTGRVARHEENLQISAELMDTRDKTQMWGEQFNRPAADVLHVQAEISRQIAERLRQRLTRTVQQQLVKGTKANPQAYELLLQGRFSQMKGTAVGLRKAVEYYQQALALDPNYALAHAALSAAYLTLGANSFADPKEMMPKAEAAARRALELDESLAEVHLALTGIKRSVWDWAGAEREFKRAIELNPNLSSAHFGYSGFLSTQGRHDEALAEMRQARELDPLRPNINADMAYQYYFARQYDLALEHLAIALEQNPAFGPVHYFLGFVYEAKGQYAEAVPEYKQMIRLLQEDHTGVECYLGHALARSGQRHAAAAILKRLETGKEYVSPVELAVLYVGLREHEKALAALERAYAAHDLQLQFLNIEPHFDGLRTDPRFIGLLRKVGLTQ